MLLKGEIQMRKWDYAEMSKEAKKHGGPEQYLADFGEEKYKEGELNGEKKGEFKGIFEGSIITVILGGTLLGIIAKIQKRREKKKLEKITECREKANIAAKKYVDEMNEHDIVSNEADDVEQEDME